MHRHALTLALAIMLLVPAFPRGEGIPQTAQAPAAQASEWTVDPAHSSASFAVRHMMVTNVRGVFGKVSGTVLYDGRDVSTVSADISIDVASIDTNNEKRDAHLRSPDFFDATTHPTMSFKSKRVEKGSPGNFKLIGDLTIRGVTKEATFDVEGPSAPVTAMGGVTKVGATATTTLNRQDFGIKWNRNMDAGGVVVGDEVKVTVELELNKNAPTPSSAP
jgi:polyisoprenoid-binding protein YceI